MLNSSLAKKKALNPTCVFTLRAGKSFIFSFVLLSPTNTVKAILFSDIGEHALPFIREAAKKYSKFMFFRYVLLVNRRITPSWKLWKNIKFMVLPTFTVLFNNRLVGDICGLQEMIFQGLTPLLSSLNGFSWILKSKRRLCNEITGMVGKSKVAKYENGVPPSCCEGDS
ncbi:hypothetical protein SELMODRAFT_416311 [Selaginella moellendorffii]|uniref:Uncharacterized protein n=1 Tax=Selaginella moellendorffii TaxID=88036 RepID=D8RYW2_SELML|nr:hypothetical protein SELMODRAFT_416311 [Selaginella moellendorffii]